MPGPPPPPPLPGMGRGGPPPPPMPPPGGLPGKKQTKGAGRGALLSSIEGGARLKKVTAVNDRSAPIIDNKNSSSAAAPVSGAPPVPGMAPRPPAPGLVPPPAPNRARSNSVESGGGNSGPPQLSGIFAGGIPKLRKAGGIDTGAVQKQSPYLSDPETSRSSAPRPPTGMAPRPPSAAAPRVPGSAPPRPPGPAPSGPNSAVSAPIAPSVAQLRNSLRPTSMASISSIDISSKPKPAPPIGKKPPMPPTSRKPSGLAPTPPTIAAPTPPSAPPPPPASAPRPPPLRSTPPPPPSIPPPSSNGTPSLAEQAARNVFERNTSTSPAAPPPPPPPSSAPSPPSKKHDSDEEYDPYKYTASSPTPPRLPPNAPSLPPPRPSISAPSAPPSRPSVSALSTPPPPPASPPSRTNTQSSIAPVRSMLDVSLSRPSLASTKASSYTLTNGGGTSTGQLPHRASLSQGGGGVVKIHDLRWRFQDDSTLPKPREWKGASVKRYRAGRVSSVPLDLSAFE